MTVRFERPVSRAAYFARRLALFGFLLFAASWGFHRFGPLDTPSFLAAGLLAVACSILAIYFAFIGLVALWRRGARGGKAATLAIALAIPALVPAGAGVLAYANLPRIYDATTDLVDPPDWQVEPSPPISWLGPRPPVTAETREAQMLRWRELTGRRYEGALDRVFAAARKVALDNRMTITAEVGAPDGLLEEVDPKAAAAEETAPADALDNIPIPSPRPGDDDLTPTVADSDAYIQGERRTLIFGFRQDVVIRLREETETTLVDIRVATRFGDHDLGSGVAFIEQYLRALDAELLGIAGD